MPSPHKLRRIAIVAAAAAFVILVLWGGNIDLYPQGHST